MFHVNDFDVKEPVSFAARPPTSAGPSTSSSASANRAGSLKDARAVMLTTCWQPPLTRYGPLTAGVEALTTTAAWAVVVVAPRRPATRVTTRATVGSRPGRRRTDEVCGMAVCRPSGRAAPPHDRIPPTDRGGARALPGVTSIQPSAPSTS